jgi:Spy/CpxP family protein refolding chaperone
MKKFIILSLGLLAVVATLSAQDNSHSQPGGPGRDGSSWNQHGKKHGPTPGAELTPDEQQRLEAAREKAKAARSLMVG